MIKTGPKDHFVWKGQARRANMFKRNWLEAPEGLIDDKYQPKGHYP
jgi:hypothetical protein